MEDKRINLTTDQEQANGATQHPGEVGYVPPTEAVPLPSRGMVYPVGHPLHGATVIEIRSMTARDEDILTSRALLKQGKAVTALLRSCLQDRSIDPDSMLVGDRNAALIAIRCTGYGSGYTVDVTCPTCEEKSKNTFFLDKLPVRFLGEEPAVPGQNSFDVQLPVLKKTATFKILTGADDRELSTILEKSRKAAGAMAPESIVTTRLLFHVIQIGGEQDRGKLAQIIRSLPAGDSRRLRTRIDEISPGVDMIQPFTCAQCATETEVDVPLGTEFFWPSS